MLEEYCAYGKRTYKLRSTRRDTKYDQEYLQKLDRCSYALIGCFKSWLVGDSPW
jgi:hypothetical protein